MQDWIETAFDLLQQELAEEDIITRLADMGCSKAKAEKLVCFLPLACGRASLADSGVSFSSLFRGMDENGTIGEPSPLAADMRWVAIERWLSSQQSVQQDAVRAVGSRSAEVDAVNKALLAGSNASNLVGSDAIFRFFYQTADAEGQRAPRWAFWRRT